MKFIHSGDVHLGVSPESGKAWAENRGREIWSTFEGLIERVNDEDADLLILAGDLFHRQPLIRELKEVNSLFASLDRAKVVLIAGNHDCIRKDSYYRTFEWSENVHFIGGEDISKVELGEYNADIYGLSYYSSEIKEARYDDIVVDNRDRINILVAHGGDDKHIPVNRRKLALAGFDYAAFGHIHIPEIDIEHKMAYCGSLEPIDINDTGERGYIIGNVTKSGLEVSFVPFSKRTYKHIDIEVTPDITNVMLSKQLKSYIRGNGADNMFKFTISGFKDPDVEYDFNGMELYGNIVKIVDETEPDYDFEKLRADNKYNMVGMFIEKFGPVEELDDVHKKALCYGTKALLSAMGDR